MGRHSPQAHHLPLPVSGGRQRVRPVLLLPGDQHGQAVDPRGLGFRQEQRVALGELPAGCQVKIYFARLI